MEEKEYTKEQEKLPIQKGGLYKDMDISEKSLNIAIIFMSLLFLTLIVYAVYR